MPGHDVRNAPAGTPPHPSVPTSFPSRVNGAPPLAAPHPTPSSTPSCLPSGQALAARPLSPAAPSSRPYPTPSIGSSHMNSSLSSSIHSHSITYQSQSSLQKHSVQSVYTSRPPHLAPFSVPNHISSNHVQTSLANQPTATHLSHPINSHSIVNQMNHLPMSNSNSLTTSTPNHIGPPLSLPPTTTSTLSSFTPNLKHPGLSLPSLSTPSIPSVTLHQPQHNHVDSPPTSTAPAVVTSNSSNSLAPPVIDSRQPALSETPARSEVSIVSSTLTSNGFPPPAVYSGATFPPLYAPYATTLQHSPYLPPAAASPRNIADTVSIFHLNLTKQNNCNMFTK